MGFLIIPRKGRRLNQTHNKISINHYLAIVCSTFDNKDKGLLQIRG
jgi:hypothetical protein